MNQFSDLDGLGMRRRHGSSVADMTNGALISTTGAGSRKVPAGVTSIDIEIWGGGGSGGGSNGTNDSGGGGSGAYSKLDNESVTPGDTISYSIGAGGASVAGNTIGNNGGDTTCNAATAGGGVGGAIITTGGAGGSASGGDINTSGNAGQNAPDSTHGGAGGSAPNGGAGGTGAVNEGAVAQAGVAPGGGGGGGENDSAPNLLGAAGANGGIKFSW